VEYNQHILEEGKKITLKEFADKSIFHLEHNVYGENEVVKHANDIIELEHDFMTRPDNIVPLPDGYNYRFSGFMGCVLGITKNIA
jgi:hypothetical protein